VHLAVFGGTFDPPHNGHLALCLFARELLALDHLIISASNNPFKQKKAVSDAHRVAMVELLAAEIMLTGCCAEVSCWELEKQQPSYTVDLIRHLHALYPHDTLTLLVGEDSFADFPSWKEPDSLMALCNVVVFRRIIATQDQHKPCWQNAITTIDFSCGISSTEIRARVFSGQSITHLVPQSIHHYIVENALYC
jgi:nicotinate-nucleotide adenylyltransferase